MCVYACLITVYKSASFNNLVEKEREKHRERWINRWIEQGSPACVLGAEVKTCAIKWQGVCGMWRNDAAAVGLCLVLLMKHGILMARGMPARARKTSGSGAGTAVRQYQSRAPREGAPAL